LKEGIDLHPGLLGINLEGRDQYGAAPVIAAVQPGSPARKAGLQANDKILQAGGRPVMNHVQLQHQLRPLYAGDQIQLVVARKDQRMEFEITLTDKLPPYAHPFLGVLPRRDDRPGKGIVVRYVFPDSGAAGAGLRPGDRLVKVADRTVTRRSDLVDALAAHVPGESVEVRWQRGSQQLAAQVSLGRLPTTIPAQLPPARQQGELQPESDAEVGVIDLKLAEFRNECTAYVPTAYDPAVPHGVVIWLPPPGRGDQDPLIRRWRDHCDADDLILLAPRASDAQRWQRDEVEFVVAALARLSQLYEIDPVRTVVHGWEAGGAMAFYVFAADKAQIHGVSVVDSALPGSLRLPPLEMASRSAIFWSYGLQHPAANRIPAQIQRLTKLHYPLTVRQREGKGAYLNDQQLAELVRWIDTLDRI
nr:PDZ domain-containing protein [Planctomycetales bacterium]